MEETVQSMNYSYVLGVYDAFLLSSWFSVVMLAPV